MKIRCLRLAEDVLMMPHERTLLVQHDKRYGVEPYLEVAVGRRTRCKPLRCHDLHLVLVGVTVEETLFLAFGHSDIDENQLFVIFGNPEPGELSAKALLEQATVCMPRTGNGDVETMGTVCGIADQ